MRISSTSLALLALSPLSMANGAKPLSRQLSHALESIQEQQSSTRSLKFKKMIRALQDQTDTDEMPQELLDALGPEIVAMLPCIGAMAGEDGMEMEMGDGGGDGDGGDDDENDPLAFLEDYRDDACDAAGICDFSIAKDDEKIKCDETGGKIILNDILFCNEDIEEDMDIIINNAPVCFPQICPDDSNAMELTVMGMKMFMISMAVAFGGDAADVDFGAIVMPGMKEECASGTKLATTDTDQEIPQEILDALGPDLVALVPCIRAMMEMADDIGDDDDEIDPLAWPDYITEDACDAAGICDFSSVKDEAKNECDKTGGKIILNDILYCKEDFGDDDEGAPDMDTILINAPFCFPQICPDDTSVIEIGKVGTVVALAMMMGGDRNLQMDMDSMVIPGMKEECASGTKLATSDNEDTETGGGSSAAARNIIWSFSVAAAAAVGIGAFLAV